MFICFVKSMKQMGIVFVSCSPPSGTADSAAFGHKKRRNAHVKHSAVICLGEVMSYRLRRLLWM